MEKQTPFQHSGLQPSDKQTERFARSRSVWL